MAINVADLRTDSMKRRHAAQRSWHGMNDCELCRKEIKDITTAKLVAIDHENYQFVTEAEVETRGDAVSLFNVGPDCYKRIQKALKCA